MLWMYLNNRPCFPAAIQRAMHIIAPVISGHMYSIPLAPQQLPRLVDPWSEGRSIRHWWVHVHLVCERIGVDLPRGAILHVECPEHEGGVDEERAR